MAMQRTTERILAVDSHPRMLASLEALAASRSLPLDTAATLAEARTRLQQGHYGVVLLDPVFPEGDGFALIREQREHQSDVDVVVLTGDTSGSAPVQALRNGVSDFLRKPCSPDELLLTVQNTLERRRLSQQNRAISNRLRRSEQLYAFIVDSSPDLIYVLDDQGRFTFINDTAQRLLGYQPEMLLGRHFSQLVVAEDRALARCSFNERRTGERATRGLELRLQRANGGDPAHVDLTAMGMYGDGDNGPAGQFLGTYGVARDVTERKHAEAIIRHQAYHDMLTGLPNRALFKDRLRQGLSQARRSGDQLAVLFLDLDRFKMVNDSLGHSFGDRLLERVARRLRGCLREGDTLARMGGDEFTVLLPTLERSSSAATVAEKCFAALETPFELDDQEIYLGVSIGIAVYPEHGETMEGLIKHADAAMYHAKGQEAMRYAFYDPNMGNKADHYLTMETGLRRALGNRELQVLYQPQVDVSSGRILGVEALLRWQHPDRGLIPPMDFIPVAEQTGLIVPISLWLLREACLEVLSWQGPESELRLAVNLSSLHVEQPDFVDGILDVLLETQFPPERLELEITEHVLMRNLDAVIEKLRELSGRGVTFAIDDFGTGYSSLSYLQRLPIHTLKIDQSFTQGLYQTTDEATLVNTIIAMAQGLGLQVVAEGVETGEQLRSLRSMQCHYMQGFLFSIPLVGPETRSLIASWDDQASMVLLSANG
ncbi:putative bifunctional diguanylate cyclase/phosphodiesterase [Aquisalimonas asiatica]|uniref:cyclic-guanylate-specific phosphodiesterase n=1 Tax=Aquisalimonas asiatica TaxID=406100 RepID=A0A1H8TLX9_9GAMM|nr:EAL domain-containing protein [Aquisalimonas asiatica]SEO91573.1 response regulator receiver modulated diguanylate cyclase/phosphodiesterase with PAS/PAC sensor(s) [Aquisalimonas asiatica]